MLKNYHEIFRFVELFRTEKKLGFLMIMLLFSTILFTQEQYIEYS